MVERAKIGIVYRDRPPELFLDAPSEGMPWTLVPFQESVVLSGPLVPEKDFLAVFFSPDSDAPEIQRHISNMFPGAGMIGYSQRGQLPPQAFVAFLQNHDQVGNRAFGERLGQLAASDTLAAVTAVLLLAPQPPLLFMGEEFAAAQPFLYFCDFAENPALAQAVTEGRRREFAQFKRFADPAVRERIPDPNAVGTFAACVLDWSALERPPHSQVLLLCRHLLQLRQQEIVPRIAGIVGNAAVTRIGRRALRLRWTCRDGLLDLHANLGPQEAVTARAPAGRLLFATANCGTETLAGGRLPPWSVAWHFTETPTA